MTRHWVKLLVLLVSLSQTSGHSKVYQAWLADDGDKSLLVVNAIPKHLLDSTIFRKLLGLRDTSIGDGENDTEYVPAEIPATPEEVTTAPSAAEGEGDAPSQPHVVEMSHKQAVYSATADLSGEPEVQHQQPRQPESDLPMLTLWEPNMVDIFVANLNRITGSTTQPHSHAASEAPAVPAVPASVVAPGPEDEDPDEETDEDDDDEDDAGETVETESSSGDNMVIAEEQQHHADDHSSYSHHASNMERQHSASMEDETEEEGPTSDSVPAVEDVPQVMTPTENPTLEEFDKAVSKWQNASSEDEAATLLDNIMHTFVVLTGQAMGESPAANGATGLMDESVHPQDGQTTDGTSQEDAQLAALEEATSTGTSVVEVKEPIDSAEVADAQMPLFPSRYPHPRHSARSAVRAELPAGVISVGDGQEIAFTPTTEERRQVSSIEFKPTAVIGGGRFNPGEFGLVDPPLPPLRSALAAGPQFRSEASDLRDSLSAVVEVVEAGLSVVLPDWREPGILVTPLHKPVSPEELCYLMVKRGACRCSRSNCRKFKKFMQYKCPGMCEEETATWPPTPAPDAFRTRLRLPSVRLPEPVLGILSKCRGSAIMVPPCGERTYVAHPIFCECYRMCHGPHAGITVCPTGEHFSTKAGETSICVPFAESSCRTWSRLLTARRER